MKSFIKFLLEGQAEIDAAIEKMDEIDANRQKLNMAAHRLTRIVNRRTQPKNTDETIEQEGERIGRNYRNVARLRRQKENKRFKSQYKNLMKSLSPEDVRGLLLSPDEKRNAVAGRYGGRTDTVILDRFAGNNSWYDTYTRMIPPDALRDASDMMSVVRAKDTTSKGIAANLQKPSKRYRAIPHIYDADGVIRQAMGGTFHERKAVRKQIRGIK